MTNLKIRLGTRKSPMAIVVAEHARTLLQAARPGIEVEILSFVSEGDKIKGDLKPFGGKGTFIKDLERRLLAGEIDCAIHALKDIPGDVPMHEDLMIAAYLAREDARDALVLRAGLTEEEFLAMQTPLIGTSAPRRQAAMRTLFPTSVIKLSRGNVNTRLEKLDSGEFDALILSGSGLARVGFEHRVTRLFSEEESLPAVGQGILCLQIRREDQDRFNVMSEINDSWSQMAASAEREILAQLQGNCHSAIAAHCSRLPSQDVQLRAAVYDPQGGAVIAASALLEPSETYQDLGVRVANQLLDAGAGKFIDQPEVVKS